MNWKTNFQKGRELILATASKSGKPNANIVISLGFQNEKLLVADSQMCTTIKNLKENPRISVISGYIRLRGTVKIFSSGKYFDYCVKQDKEHPVKHAILISAREVFDLDRMKKIN